MLEVSTSLEHENLYVYGSKRRFFKKLLAIEKKISKSIFAQVYGICTPLKISLVKRDFKKGVGCDEIIV